MGKFSSQNMFTYQIWQLTTNFGCKIPVQATDGQTILHRALFGHMEHRKRYFHQKLETWFLIPLHDFFYIAYRVREKVNSLEYNEELLIQRTIFSCR